MHNCSIESSCCLLPSSPKKRCGVAGCGVQAGLGLPCDIWGFLRIGIGSLKWQLPSPCELSPFNRSKRGSNLPDSSGLVGVSVGSGGPLFPLSGQGAVFDGSGKKASRYRLRSGSERLRLRLLKGSRYFGCACHLTLVRKRVSWKINPKGAPNKSAWTRFFSRMGAGMRPGVPQLTPASGYLVRLPPTRAPVCVGETGEICSLGPF